MMSEFEELPWHDSVLLEVVIPRHDPGNVDSVEIVVGWLDETTARITFSDCYAFSATMSFGVIAPESIDDAFLEDGAWIDAIRATWRKLDVDLADCHAYVVRTSSTGSELRIAARSVRIATVES
jgi:hypothetical protein